MIITRQKAIDLKCKDCSYDPLDKGTWVEQVAICECTSCPLHPYRPIPTRKSREDYPISSTYSAPIGRKGKRNPNLRGGKTPPESPYTASEGTSGDEGVSND